VGKHQQRAFYAQFENHLLVEAGPHRAVSFGQDLCADHALERHIGHFAGPAGHGEAIVLPRRRAGLAVQRVAPVPAQILPLGAGDDEQVQARVTDNRAHRVHPRAAVRPDRGQERQADAEVVELPAPRVGQGGLLSLELVPGHHFQDATPLSLTPCVSDMA
jgi:hypothetical protein